MTESGSSKKLANAIALLFLVVIYTGLAMIFYSPEDGFMWFVNFLLLTLAILGGFAFLVVRLSKRAADSLREAAESSANQPE